MKEYVYKLIINGTKIIYKHNHMQVEKYIENHPYDDIKVIKGNWHYTADFKERIFLEEPEDGYEYYLGEKYILVG